MDYVDSLFSRADALQSKHVCSGNTHESAQKDFIDNQSLNLKDEIVDTNLYLKKIHKLASVLKKKHSKIEPNEALDLSS